MRKVPWFLVILMVAVLAVPGIRASSAALPPADAPFLFAIDGSCEMRVDRVGRAYRVAVPERGADIPMDVEVALTRTVRFKWTLADNRPKFHFLDLSTNQTHDHNIGDAESAMIIWGDCTTTVRVSRQIYLMLNPENRQLSSPRPLGEGLWRGWQDIRP